MSSNSLEEKLLDPKNLTHSVLPVHRKTVGNRQALKIIFYAALPYAISFLISNAVRLSAYIFLKGYDDVTIVGAFGIGMTFQSIFGISIIVSLNTGLMSRLSPAFGAKNYKLMGYYLHKAFVINLIALILLTFLMYFSDTIFVSCGFRADLASNIQNFLMWNLPSLYLLMAFNTLAYYLMATQRFKQPAYMQIAASPIYVIVAYYFIDVLQMGLQGAALANIVMNFVLMMMIMVYISIVKPNSESIFCFDKHSLVGMWDMFKHEFGVGSTLFAEWIGVEVIGVLSGLLNPDETAAYVATMTVLMAFYSIPISLGGTLLSLVGGALGEGSVDKAKKFIVSAVAITILASLLFMMIFYTLAPLISPLLLESQQAVDDSIMMFRIYIIVIPADFLQFVLGAGLRAIGKQKYGFWALFFGVYLVGIPLAIVFAFVANLQLSGLIYGFMAAFYTVLAIYLFVYGHLRWSPLVERLSRRMMSDTIIAGLPPSPDMTHKEETVMENEEFLESLKTEDPINTTHKSRFAPHDDGKAES